VTDIITSITVKQVELRYTLFLVWQWDR